MTLHDIWQRSFKVISAEIIDLIKNKNDDSRPFRIKETEYDFVDPCPQEMKQVHAHMLHFLKLRNKVPISELSEVSIDWKMLTTSRPGKKMDEKLYTQ